jgi:hypothetical protein
MSARLGLGATAGYVAITINCVCLLLLLLSPVLIPSLSVRTRGYATCHLPSQPVPGSDYSY